MTRKFRTDHMTRGEAASVLRRFLQGTLPNPWDWDDFISVPLDDPHLDRIRSTCESLRERFPPADKGYCNAEGMEVIRDLLRELEE